LSKYANRLEEEKMIMKNYLTKLKKFEDVKISQDERAAS
jgi:hypothetical protein